jgi:hypothetical protein
VVVLVSLACLGAGAGLGVLVMKARLRQQQRRDKERTMEGEQIKALMFALVPSGEDAAAGPDAECTSPGAPAIRCGAGWGVVDCGP